MGPIERSLLRVDLAYTGPSEYELYFAKVVHVYVKLKNNAWVNNEDSWTQNLVRKFVTLEAQFNCLPCVQCPWNLEVI